MVTEFQGKYRPLSNFWLLKQPIYLTIANNGIKDNIEYTSVEHAFQAAKSLDMNDRLAIGTRIPMARDAKIYGGTVQLRPGWDRIKFAIMLDLVRQKFTNSLPLRSLLLGTDGMLIEGNYWHDNEWGVCTCNTCRDKYRRAGINQENLLGKILMQVREELRG